VVICGQQLGERIGAEEVAERSQTLVYEVLCTLGKRVVREYWRGGQMEQVMTLVGERHVVAGPGAHEHVEYRRAAGGREGTGAAQPSAPVAPALRVGDNVQHDVLGKGLVLRVTGAGDHTIVQISFEGDSSPRKFKADDPRIHVLGGR
jgi:hypothetical protein